MDLFLSNSRSPEWINCKIMERKSVAVIIPAYNAARYIRLAIESALAQTYRGLEIIVVDDGSTDNTSLIVQEFGDVIQYVYQSNQGLAAARNTGIRNARSQIIALLDADDLWNPEFLDVMMSFLEQNPQAAGVYCGFQYIDALGNHVGKPSLQIVPPDDFHRTQICVGNWLSACSVLFRKELAEEVGLFDESLKALEDADLWIRLSESHPFIGLPRALVKYRRHENNMSKDPQHMIRAHHQVLEKNFGAPVGDVSSWDIYKITAYRLHFAFAATRYLACGDIKRSAQFLQQLSEILPDQLYRLDIWRGLVRARVPDEYQFDPSFEFDCAQAYTDIAGLLQELAQDSGNPINKEGRSAKMKGTGFLALADEAGRNAKIGWSMRCLLRAVRCYPQIVLSRPFWGTIYRSLNSFIRRWFRASTPAGYFVFGV